jgi:hypothetical protein
LQNSGLKGNNHSGRKRSPAPHGVQGEARAGIKSRHRRDSSNSVFRSPLKACWDRFRVNDGTGNFARGLPIYNVINPLSLRQLDLSSIPTIPAEKSGPCSFQAAGKRCLIRRNTVFFIEKYRIHPLYSFAHQTYK